MSDKKISQLDAVTTVEDTDEYVVARAGASNKITGASLKAALGGHSSLLGGDGAPTDNSVLDPIAGIYGWSDAMTAWVGPAYTTSWGAGDFPAYPPINASADNLDIIATASVGLSPSASSAASGIDGTNAGNNINPGVGTSRGGSGLAGVGIVFVTQFETAFGGPTSPPFPDLDVRDYLGDLTGGGTQVPWTNDPGTGADGDFYIDLVSHLIYGPRASGAWGSPYSVFSIGNALGSTETLPAAATDPASVITLANAIRTALIDFGLAT